MLISSYMTLQTFNITHKENPIQVACPASLTTVGRANVYIICIYIAGITLVKGQLPSPQYDELINRPLLCCYSHSFLWFSSTQIPGNYSIPFLLFLTNISPRLITLFSLSLPSPDGMSFWLLPVNSFHSYGYQNFISL